MKIWTVTYNDDEGVRTEVFNNPESVNTVALSWLQIYWTDYTTQLDTPLEMPDDWRKAYFVLENDYGDFMDSIHVTVHDVHSPEPDAIDQVMIEAVNTNDELEVDDNAIVSWGDDPGAFVQTWTWVRFSAVEQDMVIIEEGGTVWYFDAFAEFLEAWASAPETARFEHGTPELLEKSEGANDAWEFLTREDRRSGNV